ncbi:MAG TPA: glycolate oxidase subunit GlcF [Micropepsaceae bacterium]|nr:glycolate oxidase subunit GlcF [Micropepsaceae bacterium]
MRTNFSPDDLTRPEMQRAEASLRACVHCGLCNPVCPTQLLTGDELDGPRGRVQLIQNMLESKKPPGADTVHHLDRCLGCLACKATCPSGVDYAQLIDTGRAHIAENYRRPWRERAFRKMLSVILSRPGLARTLMGLARVARPLTPLLPRALRDLAARAPAARLQPTLRPGVYRAEGRRKMRVALLRGCIQRAAASEIDESTVRLLTRLGAEVVVLPATGCCGALSWHMGERNSARRLGRRNLAAWAREMDGAGLDGVIANATGCTTMLKDYAHMFEEDDGWSFRGRRIAAVVKDATRIVAELGLPELRREVRLTVAWHPPCSMQHGLGLGGLGEQLLTQAGYDVRLLRDSHLCCGSAGAYSLLQPELAGQLKAQKADAINETGAGVLASANFGCLDHLRGAASMPAVHIIELLDWATGGPRPLRL